MRIYDIVFYATSFFLIGILLASTKLNFLIILVGALIISIILISLRFFKTNYSSKLFIFSALILFTVVGAFYYLVFENYQLKNTHITYNQKIIFSGVVSDILERGQNQKLAIDLQNPYSGKVLIKLKPYPEYKYGDLIKLEGKIEKPEGDYATYLEKDGIYGISNFPKNNFVSSGNGSAIKSFLLGIKEKIVSSFEKVLSPEKSAFLSGLTFGERTEFSKEFKNQMSKSGTTHLVALSGYNISILVAAVSILLGYFLSRRATFWVTILIIVGFVLMTGAEASVVRAAIMGAILLLANKVGRIYSFRNAIVITAFFMVLVNPKILRFDIGFQLSFMALIGIIYLQPAIKKIFKISEDNKSLLNWKENFITTLSAQVAVAPILIISFSSFSPISLFTNILVLSAIPITMSLGFILGILGVISYYPSLVFSWLINIPLSYEIFVIKFFGNLNIFQFQNISKSFVFIYYIALVFFIIYNQRKLKTKK